MAKDVIMPVLGMNQDTALLVSWLAKEGDTVSEGDPIMEVETDKAVMQLDAPASGVLVDVTANEGDDVTVGSVIARIVAEGEAPPPPAKDKAEAGTSGTTKPTPPASEASNAAPPPAEPATPPSEAPSPATAPAEREGPRTPASPLARRTAEERGHDLDSLPGSGPHGAVLMRDVPEAGAASTAGQRAVTEAGASTSATSGAQTMAYGEVERRIDATRLLELLAASGDVPAAAALARFLTAVVARRATPDRDAGVTLAVRSPKAQFRVERAERLSILDYGALLADPESTSTAETPDPSGPADVVLVHADDAPLDAIRPASEAPLALGVAQPHGAATLVLTLRYRSDRFDDALAMTMLADLARLVDDPTALAVAF